MSAKCTLSVSKIVLILIFYVVHQVSTLHTSFCIRFPKDKKLDPTYGATGEANVASVGVEKYPPDIWNKYAFSKDGPNKDDGTGKETTIQFVKDDNPGPGLLISLHPIFGRPRGEDPLTGWFRVSVQIGLEMGFSHFLRSFILFATDEQANFVGTFEHEIFERGYDCSPSDATRHMIIPCGGVSKYEPFVSNVILYARNNSDTVWPNKYKQDWPIVPNFEHRNELNFYYRFSMQASNKNKKSHIIIRLIADPDYSKSKEILAGTDENLLSVTAHFMLRDGAIPGAADPLPNDRSSLECSNHIITDDQLPGYYTPNFYAKKYLDHRYMWFMQEFWADQQADSRRPGLGNFGPTLPLLFDFTVYTKTGCSAYYFGGRCGSTLCSKSVEGTGLASTKRNKADFDLIPQIKSTKTGGHCNCANLIPQQGICTSEAPEVATLFNNEKLKFHNFMDYYKNQVLKVNCPKTLQDAERTKIRVIRRKPRTGKTTVIVLNSTVTDITAESGSSTQTEEYKKHSIDQRGVRTFGFGTLLYSVRKGHGVVMLLMSIFCVPVSIFVSRYYKETFMTKRILYSRVWFQIHLQLVFWMCALFMAGLLLAFVGRGFLGVSLHPYGLMHRIIGWITFGIFVVVACTGGIRQYDEPGRSCTIVTHWTLGYLFYIFTVLSVISSIHVPGSPISQRDKSVDERNIKEASGNYIYIVISFWIIFELVVHVTMNFLLHTYDRWMQVEQPRKYLPAYIGVPIPVIKENSNYDASGNGIRLIVFWIYIGVSAMLTFLVAGICVNGTPNLDKGFGPMSCTHEWSNSLKDAIYHNIKYQMKKNVDPACL